MSELFDRERMEKYLLNKTIKAVEGSDSGITLHFTDGMSLQLIFLQFLGWQLLDHTHEYKGC